MLFELHALFFRVSNKTASFKSNIVFSPLDKIDKNNIDDEVSNLAINEINEEIAKLGYYFKR